MEENVLVKVKKETNGLGVAGFVVALIGLIQSWIPVVNLIAMIYCSVAFLLCFISLFLKNKKKIMPIIGLVFSTTGAIFFYLVYQGIFSSLSTNLSSLLESLSSALGLS